MQATHIVTCPWLLFECMTCLILCICRMNVVFLWLFWLRNGVDTTTVVHPLSDYNFGPMALCQEPIGQPPGLMKYKTFGYWRILLYILWITFCILSFIIVMELYPYVVIGVLWVCLVLCTHIGIVLIMRNTYSLMVCGFGDITFHAICMYHVDFVGESNWRVIVWETVLCLHDGKYMCEIQS